MRSPLRLGASLSVALVLCATRLCGKEPPAFEAKLSPALPCPALVAAAQKNQLPLGPIEATTDANKLALGDSVTALVTLCEKHGVRSQWLLHLEAVAADPGDPPAKARDSMIYYSSLGSKLEYSSTPAFVDLRLLGPFVESKIGKKPPAPRDQKEHFTLDEGFLGLGLDKAAAAVFRARQIKGSPLGVGFSGKAFSEADIAKSRKEELAVRITHDEERALAGALVALGSYMDVISQIPGLKGMMLKVAELPSLWSVLWHRGVKIGFTVQQENLGPAEVAGWGLPAHTPVYYFPLEFDVNNHHAMDVTLVVTSPRPPLLECGGIVGFVAEKPGDKQTYLTLRIVSAHCARTGHDE